MEITRKNWMQYIQNLAKADDKAADLITNYLAENEILSDKGFQAFVDFYYAVVTKYAEGASEMAAQAYEALAEAQGALIKSAIPAETPSYGECIKTVRGTMLDSDQAKSLAQSAGRLVRRTGVDTTINNALRDGAEWAWVPSGDTCAFCMMLASNGWQRASKRALKKGHAAHVHANCDCTYAIRFDGKSTVEGYDPDRYKAMYNNASGETWQEKLNSMRRDKYAVNKDKINAQKRANYALKKDYKSALKGFNSNGNNGNMADKPEVLPRVPNSITAGTAQEKLQKYILNSNHPTGKHKARVMNSVLGFHYQNWDELSDQIFDKLQTTSYTKSAKTEYGTKYIVPMRITGKKGKDMEVTTVWQIDNGSNIPRFITMTFDLRTVRSV